MHVNDFPTGVRPLDHTADIGMDVTADSLPQLFRRAAEGMLAFTASGPAPPHTPSHDARVVAETIRLSNEDTTLLLAAWLRELLFLMETRRLCYEQVEFSHLDERSLAAVVQFQQCPEVFREIKGVTYHELDVRFEAGRWSARVIFDV